MWALVDLKRRDYARTSKCVRQCGRMVHRASFAWNFEEIAHWSQVLNAVPYFSPIRSRTDGRAQNIAHGEQGKNTQTKQSCRQADTVTDAPTTTNEDAQ